VSGVRRPPIRTCVGCGVRAEQVELLRLRAQSGGPVVFRPERSAGGRSAYLHRDEKCWQRFAKRKGSVRSLRRTLDRDARARLVEAVWQELVMPSEASR
jgi:hypothetical protein